MLAFVSVSATAAKTGGGTPDACATAVDFPSFAYASKSGSTWTMYVADSTGRCSRSIASTLATPRPLLSYPVGDQLNRGRVVWKSSGKEISAVDFTVASGNVVTVIGTPQIIITTLAACCVLDLSRDGQAVYFSDSNTSVARFDFTTGGTVTQVYSMPPEDSSWFYQFGTINGDQTKLFATKSGNGINAGAIPKLVRIDLGEAPSEHVLRAPETGGSIFTPAASKTADRVAFVGYVTGTSNCTPLIVADSNGVAIVPAPADPVAYGTFPTWVGDSVLMEGRTPPDKFLKCASTGSILRVEPNNVQTALVIGKQPDGR
jgi:hypothetical protein